MARRGAEVARASTDFTARMHERPSSKHCDGRGHAFGAPRVGRHSGGRRSQLAAQRLRWPRPGQSGDPRRGAGRGAFGRWRPGRWRPGRELRRRRLDRRWVEQRRLGRWRLLFVRQWRRCGEWISRERSARPHNRWRSLELRWRRTPIGREGIRRLAALQAGIGPDRVTDDDRRLAGSRALGCGCPLRISRAGSTHPYRRADPAGGASARMRTESTKAMRRRTRVNK